MRDDFDAECFIGNEYISGEGYVMAGDHGTYKLVDRESSVIITLISFVRDTAVTGVDPPVYKNGTGNLTYKVLRKRDKCAIFDTKIFPVIYKLRNEN